MAAASKSSSNSENNSGQSLTSCNSALVSDASCLCVDDSSHQLENSEKGGAAKKLAWNKPSNRAAAAEVGSAIGGESWPTLSDSARAPSKSSLLPLNGSVTVSEEMLAVSLSPQKECDTTMSTASHISPSGHRSMNSGVDRMAASSSSLSPDPSILGALTEAHQHNAGNTDGSGPRGRPFGGNEVHSQNGPIRNNSGPRADGFHHHRHGARRDTHRKESFPSRKRDGSRPFVRGPTPNGPFAPPPLPPPPLPIVMRPIVNHMFYELPHVYYVPSPHLNSPRPMHMVSYSPTFFPPYDPNLSTQILNQIDYYFSNENLVKDTFLRRNMDSEGWVSVKLIAGFKKVTQLTDNIHLILDALQASNVVEVQGDKVRCKIDWNKWLMPHGPSHSIHNSDQDNLASHFSSAALHEKAASSSLRS